MNIPSIHVIIFMMASLLCGLAMIISSIMYNKLFRGTEISIRYLLGVLLLFSVFIRFVGCVEDWSIPYFVYSPVFDVLYISIAFLKAYGGSKIIVSNFSLHCLQNLKHPYYNQQVHLYLNHF